MRRIIAGLAVAVGLAGCAVYPDGTIAPAPVAVAPVYVAPRPVVVAPGWGWGHRPYHRPYHRPAWGYRRW